MKTILILFALFALFCGCCFPAQTNIVLLSDSIITNNLGWQECYQTKEDVAANANRTNNYFVMHNASYVWVGHYYIIGFYQGTNQVIVQTNAYEITEGWLLPGGNITNSIPSP